MQEQNFEKQVREKLNDLSFTPSTPVWEKVQQQIGSKKERRYHMLWLLPLLFAGAGLGYWLLQSDGTDSSTGRETISVSSVEQKNESVNTPPPTAHPATALKEQKETDKTTQEKKTATAKNVLPKPAFRPVGSAGTYYKPRIVTSKTKASTAKEISGYDINRQRDQDAEENQSFSSLPSQKRIVPGPESQTDDRRLEIVEPLTVPRKNSLQSQLLNDTSYRNKTTASALVVVQKKQVKPGWQFGVDVQAGITGLSSGFPLIGNQNKSSLNFSADPANGPAPNAAFRYPSSPQEAFSWSAGLIVKRNLTARTAFLSGINYTYNSTKQVVGQAAQQDTVIVQRSNSAARLEAFSYYRTEAQGNAQKNKYINRYHYADVPIGIEQQLFNRLPLYVQGGFSFGYLFSSRALRYDTAARIYYKDPALPNRAQVQLFTGLHYRISGGNKMQVTIGPSLRYSFSRLDKETLFGERHWYSVRFGASVLF